MGRATSKDNEAKLKMKHPSDICPGASGLSRWNTLPVQQLMANPDVGFHLIFVLPHDIFGLHTEQCSTKVH